ncbi:transposase [Kitasatospora sp. NPDC127116]|uniref:IS110 family transposase n=1 Tax=Kitasatospora sp. NPDC127116 TaxID=3345367 RepID=UPI003632B6E7
MWAGADIGKTHPHAVVINEEGERLLSRRTENDKTELPALIGDVLLSGVRSNHLSHRPVDQDHTYIPQLLPVPAG